MSWENISIEKRKELAAKIAETKRKNNSYKQNKESIEKMKRTSRERGLYDSNRMKKVFTNKGQNPIENAEEAKRRRLDQRIENRTKRSNGEEVEIGSDQPQIKRRGSQAENMFNDLLCLIGLKEDEDYYRYHRIGKYSVDFFFVQQNLVVEINGCFIHQCDKCNQDKGSFRGNAQEIRDKDAKRIEYLRSKDYLVHIVWEHDLKD